MKLAQQVQYALHLHLKFENMPYVILLVGSWLEHKKRFVAGKGHRVIFVGPSYSSSCRAVLYILQCFCEYGTAAVQTTLFCFILSKYCFISFLYYYKWLTCLNWHAGMAWVISHAWTAKIKKVIFTSHHHVWRRHCAPKEYHIFDFLTYCVVWPIPHTVLSWSFYNSICCFTVCKNVVFYCDGLACCSQH